MAHKTFVSQKAVLEVDGRKLVLAPLTLLQVQRLRELQEQIETIKWLGYLEKTSELIWESARVNDSELTLAQVTGVLTVESWRFALNELMAVSGMVLTPEGEDKPKSLTGQNSTA